jgi:hypothetical protein
MKQEQKRLKGGREFCNNSWKFQQFTLNNPTGQPDLKTIHLMGRGSVLPDELPR